MKLTISMATYDDFDGVYFTIQAIRMYHKLDNVEFLVLDNNPTGPHSAALKHFLLSVPNAKYIEVTNRKSSWVKYDAFLHATGDVILGLDCHLLLVPGFFDALLSYFQNDQNKLNMLTGPLVYNDLKSKAPSLTPCWGKHDFGMWSSMPKEPVLEPFEIEAQGMGCFSFHKDGWKPIPTTFNGFGAEEWFMAEHTRKGGGKVICHPNMGWMHRFGRPSRTFPLTLEDKIKNYYIGWLDIYESMDHPKMVEMTEHWKTQIPESKLNEIIKRIVPNNAHG